MLLLLICFLFMFLEIELNLQGDSFGFIGKCRSYKMSSDGLQVRVFLIRNQRTFLQPIIIDSLNRFDTSRNTRFHILLHTQTVQPWRKIII